jgi:hypothetical protein
VHLGRVAEHEDAARIDVEDDVVEVEPARPGEVEGAAVEGAVDAVGSAERSTAEEAGR